MPKTKEEPKPYSGICCSRCWIAKSEKKKCRCKCKGAHHGNALKSDEQKHGGSCPRCGFTNVFEVPHRWAPDGMTAFECRTCHNGWNKPKT